MRMNLAKAVRVGGGGLILFCCVFFFVNASKLATQGCPQDPDVVHKLFISDEYI